jgi:hypothetical protein
VTVTANLSSGSRLARRVPAVGRLGAAFVAGTLGTLGSGPIRVPMAAPRPTPASLRYEPAQLDCARFRERSRSVIETFVAGETVRETAGLDGGWRFRAAPGPGDSLRLEAWFDTLSVWRRSERDSLEPDTDGIIGGRYRGMLSPDGRYRAETRPFVPDPLQEVADLSRALDDLLPPLPPRLPAFGESWSDGAGLEIRLLRRERRITVETYVPTEARVRRPVQARIEQRVVLERMADGCERGAAGAGLSRQPSMDR